MLIKKKLLQIKPMPCPDRRKTKKQYKKFTENYDTAYQIKDGILILDMYQEGKLKLRFFADKKNWQWYEPEIEQWSQTLRNMNCYSLPETFATELTEGEMQGICDFLDVIYYGGESLKRIIYNYASNIQAKKRWRYEENKNRRIRETKAESVYIPKGLNKWSLNNIFSPISMFRPKQGKTYRIKCLCCGHEAQVEKIKHREEWKCPRCRRTTTAIAERYITSKSISENAAITIPRKIKGGFAAVHGELHRSFDKEGNQHINFFDYQIYHEKNGTITRLYCSKYSWWGYKLAKDRLSDKSYLYTPNLKRIFLNGKYKGINLMKLKGRLVDVISVFDSSGYEELISKLCKAGLFGLIGQENCLKGGNSFSEISGLNPNYITAFREYGFDISMVYKLEEFHKVFRRKGTYTPEQLLIMENLNIHDVYRLSKYMGDIKLLNYFERQMSLQPKVLFRTIAGWYMDYMHFVEWLNENTDVNIDTSSTMVRFPKDIKAAHDRMEKNMRAVKDVKTDQLLNAYAEKYKKIPIPKGKYTVMYPICREDMVNEGNTLNHCVGWNPIYYERQISGEYITFFIRKRDDEDTPFYTATYRWQDEELVFKESHGAGHKAPTKEVMTFIEKYMKNANKALSKERTAA